VYRPLVLIACLASGCLPAYDNMFMSGSPDDGGTGSDALEPSGFNVTGAAVNLEDIQFGAGQTVRFSTLDDPAFISAASDANGHFTLPIPKTLINQQDYFIIEGTYKGAPILRTHYLPRINLDGKADNTNILVHYLRNDTMTTARALIAQSMVTHGDLTSADQFASTYSFMLGSLVESGNFGLRVFKNYTVSISVDGGQTTLDQTNCNPKQQCCLYYTYDYNMFVHASPMPATLIDYGATQSPALFAVVCPASQTGEVTFTQTAPLAQIVDQSTNQHPTKSFPNITAPRIAGDGVLIVWSN
jgi:hypothetical protein